MVPMGLPTQERTALYRLYDAGDRLLYIGISNNPEARWARHRMYLVAPGDPQRVLLASIPGGCGSRRDGRGPTCFGR